MELASKYSPAQVEGKWYQYWMDNRLFSSKPDGREPYTVVIPPPNVTGVLHMGHVLNETIQDILVRRARMEGKNACWVPGTDHSLTKCYLRGRNDKKSAYHPERTHWRKRRPAPFFFLRQGRAFLLLRRISFSPMPFAGSFRRS